VRREGLEGRGLEGGCEKVVLDILIKLLSLEMIDEGCVFQLG